MSLGTILKDLRKKAHLTQQQVADAIGIQRGTYAYYELDKSTPKTAAMIDIANLYRITVDELIGNVPAKRVAQNSEPIIETDWSTTDKFNDLSSFEQSVLLKIRLMSKDEKNKLAEYLSKF